MTDHQAKLGEVIPIGDTLSDGTTEVSLRGEDWMVPLLGLAVNPYHPDEVADALDAVRQAVRQLGDFRGELERLLAEEAQRRGTKTLHLGSADVTITGGPEKKYDIEVLAELQERGLPEDRYDQLVKTHVEYRVDKNVIKQLLGSGNDDYVAIIRLAEYVEEKPWRASVKRA